MHARTGITGHDAGSVVTRPLHFATITSFVEPACNNDELAAALHRYKHVKTRSLVHARIARTTRNMLPGLVRGPFAGLLLAIGIIGALLELVHRDTMVIGRLVVFVLAGMAGLLGMLRRRK